MINSEFQLEIVTDLAVEPVTLQEAKDYMRISSDSENDLIEELITSARERIEKYTGLSLGLKTLKAYWFYFHVPAEIPYGPVTAINSVVDDNDVELEYTARGLQYKTLEAYSTQGLAIEYEAGFAVCPKGLKLAILKQVSTDYENRENYSIYDQAYELSSDARRQAMPYCRNTILGI
jgi:uncharacterized phiE125 gp8 family phage protein